MDMYVIMDRSSIEECSSGQNDGQWHPRIEESSESDEYDVTQVSSTLDDDGDDDNDDDGTSVVQCDPV